MEDKTSVAYLKSNILSKGASGGIGIKGVNKILYPVNKSYGRDELRVEETKFISKLRNIFN